MPLTPSHAASLAHPRRWRPSRRAICLSLFVPLAVLTVAVSPTLAASLQPSSPWENAVAVLQNSFTGTIARGLSLVAIVIGGLMFAFSEGSTKRLLAGIVFGVGMAIGAANFMRWLFP